MQPLVFQPLLSTNNRHYLVKCGVIYAILERFPWQKLRSQVPTDAPPCPLPTLLCMLSCFSRVRLFVILWTVALKAPLSMGILQASGLPFPTPGDLPDPKIKLAFPALAGRFFTASTTWEAQPILYPFSIVFGFFFFFLLLFSIILTLHTCFYVLVLSP